MRREFFFLLRGVRAACTGNRIRCEGFGPREQGTIFFSMGNLGRHKGRPKGAAEGISEF